MKIIRGMAGLRMRGLRGSVNSSVVSIGNFDGVHLGHQSILAQLKRQARLTQAPTVVILFEPQPQEFFVRAAAPARLSRFVDKVALLAENGIDYVLCLRFTAAFAKLSAQEFIAEILVEGLHSKHIIVGDDFCFGHARSGNFTTLVQAGQSYGFSVENTHTFSLLGERVSSTRVRESLAKGLFEQAETLLGRPYSMHGRIIHGKKLGRDLGFPTANLALGRNKSPLNGIYCVHLRVAQGRLMEGVASLGSRPTVDGKHMLLEVHLFDFNADLYGQRVEVIFRNKIRDEQTFANLDLLTLQIAQDCQIAKDFFARQMGANN
ncbi:MAG: bifunctional riboflavin kinase/FAD synthetase [Thiohalomonadales bacterium]